MAQAATPSMQHKEEVDDFLDSVRKGLLLGAAALAVILPPTGWHKARPQATPVAASAAAVQALPPVVKGRLPDFKGETPPEDVLQMAAWTLDSGDNGAKSFAIIDKRQTRVWLFDPQGKLTASTPALLGGAVGDHTVPGIGSKAIADILPEERTTPAGRFVAQMGVNTRNEDIVWVDYDAAVSMHRVRALVASERRLERLASPTVEDNRVSWGCINLPVAFYEDVLRPAVKSTGVVVYILPEVKSMKEAFASFYEVPAKGPTLTASRTLAAAN